eukprot:Opistho-1_new@68393
MADDSEGEDYVLYRNRPDWADVVPIPQDDGPAPVVAIAYTEEFKDAMDYFRAVVRAGELSQRALGLTADVIRGNAANYTAWHYRRLVLDAVGDWRRELSYCGEMALENPKNYQIWYHRRVVVERLGDPSAELEFTATSLADDSKNYHAWTHRQWVNRTFKLWDGELAFVDRLLSEDVRNNSAWNHRYFVVTHTTGWTPSVVETETGYALAVIRRAPNNESPWSYVRGVLRSSRLSDAPAVVETCDELYAKGVRSAHLLAALVDIRAQQGRPAEAVTLCRALGNDVDTIRKKYWEFRANQLAVAA